MENEIVEYLSKYIEVSKELEEEVQKSGFIKRYKKGTVLLEKGKVCNECFFILKGCVRSYYIMDGDERTTEFYTEEQAITPSCYGKNIPSEHFLECVEDTLAGVGTPELEEQMYEKFPQLLAFNRIMAEKIMANFQDNFDEFKMATPEQRYVQLMTKRPDLLQRAPQHQIASYLGIKPESLSRIRKSLAKK